MDETRTWLAALINITQDVDEFTQKHGLAIHILKKVVQKIYVFKAPIVVKVIWDLESLKMQMNQMNSLQQKLDCLMDSRQKIQLLIKKERGNIDKINIFLENTTRDFEMLNQRMLRLLAQSQTEEMQFWVDKVKACMDSSILEMRMCIREFETWHDDTCELIERDLVSTLLMCIPDHCLGQTQKQLIEQFKQKCTPVTIRREDYSEYVNVMFIDEPETDI